MGCETLQLYVHPTDVWLCDKLLVLDNLDMLMHGSSDSEYSLSFAYRLKRTTAVCIGCEHCCSSVVAERRGWFLPSTERRSYYNEAPRCLVCRRPSGLDTVW